MIELTTPFSLCISHVREPVQFFPVRSPVRHPSVQNTPESPIVRRFDQVRHFVDDDVFKTVHGPLCQFQVEPDSPGPEVTTPPTGLHLPDAPLRYRNAHYRLPGRDQSRHRCFQTPTIPIRKHALPFIPICARANAHFQRRIAQKVDTGWPPVSRDVQLAVETLDVVVLSRYPGVRGFSFAVSVFFLLPPDPRLPFDYGLPDRFIVDVQRSGNPHATVGRTYPEVQVPDPLPVDIHLQAFHTDLVRFGAFDGQPLLSGSKLRRRVVECAKSTVGRCQPE